MSSHHFVKEGQEPALFIFDAVSFDIVGPLLEWAPLVLVSEDALECTRQWGIKIDVVLAEEKNVERLTRELMDQAPLKILSHQQEESCMVNSLQFLISNKHSHVNVLVSHAEAVLTDLENFTGNLQVSVMDNEMKWSAIKSGKYEKWVEANTKFKLRIKSEPHDILLHGLRKGDGYLESIATGLIRIQSEKLFWIGEPHL